MMQKAAKIPLPEKRKIFWQDAIKKSREKRKKMATKYDWEGNLERYEPKDREHGDDISIGVDFSDVEQKKAALVFDTPTVALTDVSAGLEQPVAIHQELLNTLLGPEHADVLPTVLKAIFNCLCTAGIGPVLVGYQCTVQPTEVEVDAPEVDPTTGEPLKDLFGVPVMGKQMQAAEIPIHEKWFVAPLSPMSALLPAELRDTAYQKAASWMGYDWEKPLSQLAREFDLPEDWSGKGGESEDKPYFKRDDTSEVNSDPMVSGSTIWIRASLEPSKGGQVVHPDLMRRLTFADGVPEPLEYIDSPDQEIGPDGRITPDSLIGFNVRPLVLRDLADSAWPAPDCSMTAALTKEMERYREGSLRKRDTNVSAIAYETREGAQEAVEKAQKESRGGVLMVPVKEGTLAGGNWMQQLTVATAGRETYQDQELIRSDRARILAIDSNQSGVNTPTKRTATESSIVQRNTDARFEQERKRVLHWFLYDIVRPFDALVLRYCDERKAIEILGPMKGAAWAAAKQNLIGGYRYSVQVDSGKYMDVEADRKQILNVINFAAKSPNVNQGELWKKFAEKFGYDPSTFLVQPQPPKPEPPKVNLAFSGDDFAAPQGPVVLAILQQLGVQIDPAAIMAMQSAQALQLEQQMNQAVVGASAKQEQHGGGADKAERIDQHNLDISGKLPGSGMV